MSEEEENSEPVEQKLDPELRMKLLEVERSAPPDYPDWRRGVRVGLLCAIPIGLALVVIVSCFSRGNWSEYASFLLITLAFFLIGGAVGALKHRDL